MHQHPRTRTPAPSPAGRLRLCVTARMTSTTARSSAATRVRSGGSAATNSRVWSPPTAGEGPGRATTAQSQAVGHVAARTARRGLPPRRRPARQSHCRPFRAHPGARSNNRQTCRASRRTATACLPGGVRPCARLSQHPGLGSPSTPHPTAQFSRSGSAP